MADTTTPDEPGDDAGHDDAAPPLSLDDIGRLFAAPAPPEPSAEQREAQARPFRYLITTWQGHGLTEDQSLRLLAYWLRAGEARAA